MNFNDTNELIIVDEHVDVYADTDVKSEVIVSYNAGDAIYINGKSDEWFRVVYQGREGYMKAVESAQSADILNGELDDEFERTTSETDTYIEGVQAAQAYRRSNLFWIGAIAVILLAIIGVTIYERKHRRGDKEISDGHPEESNTSSGEGIMREWDDNIDIISLDDLPEVPEDAEDVLATDEGVAEGTEESTEEKNDEKPSTVNDEDNGSEEEKNE